MRKPKRLGHKIGIGLIIIMLVYICLTQPPDDNRTLFILTFLVIIAFVVVGYFRMYQFYRLEKMQLRHEFIDFVDYFNNQDFIMMGLKHAVLPKPIWKRLSNKKENKLRITINVLTVLVYLLFGTYIFISTY